MEPRQFDTWTRALAGASRRAAIRALAAGVLAALLGGQKPAAAAPFCRRVGKRCRRKSECCSRRCRRGRCRPGPGTCRAGADACLDPFLTSCNGQSSCVCWQRRQGGTRCGEINDQGGCGGCSRDEQCRLFGFGADSFCAKGAPGANCPCTFDDNFCVRPCGN